MVSFLDDLPGLLALLLLQRRQGERLAKPVAHLLPQPEVGVLVPGQHADPGLHVVVHAQGDVVGRGDFSGGVGDLVFGLLVLEGEFASVLRGEVLVFARDGLVGGGGGG